MQLYWSWVNPGEQWFSTGGVSGPIFFFLNRKYTSQINKRLFGCDPHSVKHWLRGSVPGSLCQMRPTCQLTPDNPSKSLDAWGPQTHGSIDWLTLTIGVDEKGTQQTATATENLRFQSPLSPLDPLPPTLHARSGWVNSCLSIRRTLKHNESIRAREGFLRFRGSRSRPKLVVIRPPPPTPQRQVGGGTSQW